MNRYGRLVVRRLLEAVPVLIGITIVTFLLVRALPGDPARAIAGLRASPEVLAEVRQRIGVDEPAVEQYRRYVGRVVQGDLGTSFVLDESINGLVRARLPATLFLISYAVALALLIGVPLALWSALRRNRWPDHLVRGLLVVLLGIPSFWLGILLVTYLALETGWFPSGGYGTGLTGHLRHLFLPAVTLAVTFLAVLVRSLRASTLEVLEADYVALARLKGIPQRRLLSRHVLRNALRPAVTIVGLNMSFLLGASVIVESVFAVDGIGSTLVQAILARDFLLVQGIALVFGVIVLLITLVVDLTQTALDPRQGA